ncbi:MAG: HEAT repeat domain-containing protein [Elusimicrobiales bacterium]
MPKSDTAILLEQAQAGSEAAVVELLANIEDYKSGDGNKGAFEDNLKARLKAIDSIWALGEIGDPRLMAKLEKFYADSDDVLKMNLVISMSKLEKAAKAGPLLRAIAADPGEAEVVRAVAFEALDLIGSPAAIPGLERSGRAGIEKADLIYTGGIVGTVSGWFSPDLPIGHSGVFVGTEAKDGRINVVIADCVPNNFKPGGVRNIYSFYNFTHQYKFPFYGFRSTVPRPTAAQRERIVAHGLELGKKGLKYNDTHFTQKGPVEFDCVGYTEFLYESAGLNPTPDGYETGVGWPLTPWEQFMAVVPPPAKPASPIVAPNQGILTNAFGALNSAFGRKSTDLPEVPADIQPRIVD